MHNGFGGVPGFSNFERQTIPVQYYFFQLINIQNIRNDIGNKQKKGRQNFPRHDFPPTGWENDRIIPPHS